MEASVAAGVCKCRLVCAKKLKYIHPVYIVTARTVNPYVPEKNIESFECKGVNDGYVVFK